jgi:hypothetical protein
LRGGCPPFSPPSPPPRPMRHSRPVTPSPTRPSPMSACRVRHDCTRRMRLQPFANDFRWGFLPNESPSAPLSPQVLSIRMRRHRRPRCALEGGPRLVCALRLRRSEELNPFDVGSFDGVATSQPHDPQEPQQWRDGGGLGSFSLYDFPLFWIAKASCGAQGVGVGHQFEAAKHSNPFNPSPNDWSSPTCARGCSRSS